MVCIFIRPARRPTSRLAWVILLSICYLPRYFVHSFQTSTLAIRRKNCGGITYKNSFSKSSRVRLDGLPRFFDNGATDAGETKTYSDKESDEVNTNSQGDNGSGQELDDVDYCCVDLEDISTPFLSREDSESTFIEYTDDGLCLPAGPTGQFKEQIANFLIEPSIEIVIASVVLLNSLLVALSTLDSISYLFPYIRNLQIIVGSIFLADFLARWFSSSREDFGFVLNPEFAIDLLVVILPLAASITPAPLLQEVSWVMPSALLQPSGLYNLQLLRVLRLRRFLEDLDTFERFAAQALGKTKVKTNVVQDWQLQFARVALSLFTLISVSTGLIYTAENTVNPNINNYFDALYFGLTTLTTVGFGDVIPVTSQGKLIVCGSIVFGVAVVPGQAAALLEALLDREDIQNGRAVNGRSEIRNDRRGGIVGSKKSSRTSGLDESTLALDTTTNCSRCGASFHWSSARYCYKCGEKFDEPR